jgi:hypothetical protein
VCQRRGAARQRDNKKWGCLIFLSPIGIRRKVHSNFRAGCGFGAAKERLNAEQTVGESHLSVACVDHWTGADTTADSDLG